MKLYDYAGSQNAWKIRQLCAHLGLEYQTEWVSIFEGESHTDDFRKMNPAGAVPVLELDDGRSLAEFNAILLYLGEGTEYLPHDAYQRAKVCQWLFFEADYVQSTIATLRHWNLTGKNERNEGQLAKRRSGALGVLAILDRHLQDHDFLSNSRYSLADIAVYAYTHLAGEAGLDMAPFVALNHWINRIGDLVGDAIPVRYYSEDSFSGRDL
ncbi:glutathione S-transferase family protein [Thalassospira alkalitolerans]|mgnify:FL=1|uniref:glutathione S-transferase family protein n=1 Tax=Thalassospira alkalitolerans TaxID=1293890 RepID=UPI0030EE57DF|tara:strand:- start:24585 stop:25217 length:633 start_codon:yes stop_codon:yes gene_type:complete